jgi:beta-glucanase (GH16 family)
MSTHTLRRIAAAVVLCLWSCIAVQGAEPAIPADPDGRPAASNLPSGKQWKLVWHDEFDGTQLDRTKWDYRLHIMQSRHKTWTEDAATLDGRGHLLLKLYEKDGDYYSSQLQTGANFMDKPGRKYSERLTWPIGKLEPPKFLHKYGYYEARCMLPKQPGWWAAFWLQSPIIGSTLDPQFSGVEIDIMENFERDGSVRHAALWNGYSGYGKGKSTKDKDGKDRPQPALMEGFHTFGVDWSRAGYVYYVDGKETWRFNDVVSDREQFILIGTECKGYRKDGPDPQLKQAQLPDYFIVDYVRVFDEVAPAVQR